MARRCTREEVVSAGRLPEFTARNLNFKNNLKKKNYLINYVLGSGWFCLPKMYLVLVSISLSTW
jgi:hypothetical protein